MVQFLGVTFVDPMTDRYPNLETKMERRIEIDCYRLYHLVAGNVAVLCFE